MCELCTTDAIILVQDIFPGISLIQARKNGNIMSAGDYGLVDFNEPFLVWKENPTRNPWPDDDDIADDTDVDDTAFEIARKSIKDGIQKWDLNPVFVYLFVSSCITAGYDYKKHGYAIEYWLTDYIASRMDKRSVL